MNMPVKTYIPNTFEYTFFGVNILNITQLFNCNWRGLGDRNVWNRNEYNNIIYYTYNYMETAVLLPVYDNKEQVPFIISYI